MDIGYFIVFVLGFLAGGVPDLIKMYLYRKQLEALSEKEESFIPVPMEPEEDPEDMKVREKEEEEMYGIFR